MANNVRKETRVTSRDSLLSPKYTIDVGLRGISTRTNTNEILQGHSGAGAAGSAGLRRTTVGSRPSKSRCLRWLTVGCRRKGFLSLTGPPKLPGAPDQQPSTWRGRSEQILLKQVGCESRKIPAPGFLTFPFIEQIRHYSRVAVIRELPSGDKIQSTVRGCIGEGSAALLLQCR